MAPRMCMGRAARRRSSAGGDGKLGLAWRGKLIASMLSLALAVPHISASGPAAPTPLPNFRNPSLQSGPPDSIAVIAAAAAMTTLKVKTSACPQEVMDGAP